MSLTAVCLGGCGGRVHEGSNESGESSEGSGEHLAPFAPSLFIGSCQSGECAGCQQFCREEYLSDRERDGEFWCDYLVEAPQWSLWSQERCPSTGLVGACENTAEGYIAFYYEDTGADSSEVREACENLQGELRLPPDP